MKIKYLPKFKKQFKKLPNIIQNQFQSRMAILINDITNPILKVHPLKGNFAGYWSMNVSGDFRALFYYEDETIVVFALIGTHSNLYG